MIRYEYLIELINDNFEIINFGDFGTGASDIWIQKAQERLNVIFPPSYIWWLKNYGGGEVMGEEIFSVYEIDNVLGGDIVYINELNRQNNFSNEHQLVIQENDQSQIFYLDLLSLNRDKECGVYYKFSGLTSFYADNFVEFLIKRITDVF